MSNVNASVRTAVDLFVMPSANKQRRLRRQKQALDQMRLAGIMATRWLIQTCRQPKTAERRAKFADITSPYIRFRRIARAVALMTKVCKICKRMVYESVSSEEWFKLIGKFVEGDEKFFDANPTNKARPFVTFVTDEDKGELLQLTFDKSEFSRENRSDHLLTDEIREILKTEPEQRTLSQEHEVVYFLKRLSTDFNGYPLEIQRRLAKCLVYDRYYPSRVLTRQGMAAETVYFVLSGLLVQKADNKKQLKELKPGDRFGERDLICGSTRTATIVTKTTVEVLSVHRQDYRAIFNMADDSNNPRYLDICRNDIVFQHFPLKKLRENPGTWAVLSYKFGRLMVKDSNDMEWIYVIKSGEARIIKHLETLVNDPDERRKRLREKKKHDKDFHNMQMIDFLSNKRYMSSHYKVDAYSPRVASQNDGRNLKSAASTMTSRSEKSSTTKTAARHGDGSRLAVTLRPHSQPINNARSRRSQDKDHQRSQTARKDNPNKASVTIELSKAGRETTDGQGGEDDRRQSEDKNKQESNKERGRGGATFIQTGLASGPSPSKRAPRKSTGKTLRIPPFVMLESLHAGQVFGFRSCLDEEERGPSVSLVSGGCEVLQINKKFFLKHADEAILGLIKVKYKPFPTEEEMLDRLDASLEWQEYKHSTVLEFLMKKNKKVKDYPSLAQIKD